MKRQLPLFLLTILIGLTTYLTTFQNGAMRCYGNICGMFFWGAHKVDGFWHISIISSAFKSWTAGTELSPMTPILANVPLRGYNILLDVVGYVISLTGIPPINIYFNILPVVWSIFMLVSCVWFARHTKQKLRFLPIFLVFVFFGTNLNFLFSVFHHHTIWDFQSFGAALNLVNLQYSWSLVAALITLGLLATYRNAHGNRIREILAICALLFLACAFKFYTGILLAIVVLTVVSKSKRDIFLTFTTLAAVVTIFYNPLLAVRSESIFSLAPFTLSDRIIEDSAYFHLPGLANAKYILIQQGLGPRLLAIHLFAFGIFIFFEFGVRLVGLIEIFRKKPSRFEFGLILAILASIFASTMLIQRGQWWNVTQFLYVGLFFISYFAARAIARHTKLTILLILFIPFNLGVWYSFSNPKIGASYIQKEELTAIEHFKKQPGDTFLYLPAHSTSPAIPPLWATADAPYVQALSGKKSWVEAEELLKIIDVKYEDRLSAIKRGEVPPVDYIYTYGPPQNFCRYDMEIRRKARLVYTKEPVYIYKR